MTGVAMVIMGTINAVAAAAAAAAAVTANSCRAFMFATANTITGQCRLYLDSSDINNLAKILLAPS